MRFLCFPAPRCPLWSTVLTWPQSRVMMHYNRITRIIHRTLLHRPADLYGGSVFDGPTKWRRGKLLHFVSSSRQVVHGALLRAKLLEREATVAAEFIANDTVRNFIAAELAPVQGLCRNFTGWSRNASATAGALLNHSRHANVTAVTLSRLAAEVRCDPIPSDAIRFSPFTPKSDQFQTCPAASPQILLLLFLLLFS